MINFFFRTHFSAGENRARLDHYSDISVPNAVILQCEFSKLSSVQPILVVVIRNGAEEFIQMYQDKGVEGFQLLKDEKYGLKLSLPQSQFNNQFTPEKRFTLIESDSGILRFIAIYTENGMNFVECVFVE